MPGLLDQAQMPSQGLLAPTPRKRPLVGLLADAIGAVDGFARSPFGYSNPPVALASDLLGIPAVQRTLDRISYGEALTKGKGMARTLKPDTADAALSLLPVAAKYPSQALGALAGLAGAADSGGGKLAMNIVFKRANSWADKSKVLPDGTVEIPMHSRAQQPLHEYRDKAFDLAVEDVSPKYEGFFRFTNNRDEPALAAAGKLRNSMNHADGFAERGVSVASGPHYGVQGYKNGYRLDGTVIGYGSDGEPLLDPSTIKVLSELMSASEIVKADRARQAAILKERGLPANYLTEFNFVNKPEDVWR